MRLTACLLVLGWVAMPLAAQAPAPPAQTAAQTAASGAPGAPPAISPGERADIQALLAANGGVETMQAGVRQAMKTMTPLLGRMLPPGAYQHRLLQLYTREYVAELRPVQARILTDEIARHYSDAEIRQLTAFYRSPLGRKVVALRPAIRADAQARGVAAFRRLGREAMIKVLQEHPELEREMKQAARAAAAERQR